MCERQEVRNDFECCKPNIRWFILCGNIWNESLQNWKLHLVDKINFPDKRCKLLINKWQIRAAFNILIGLHMKSVSFLSLWSKTMKWETDTDLRRGAAVTHIHFEYFSGFFWLSLSAVYRYKAPFLFVIVFLLCVLSVTVKEKDVLLTIHLLRRVRLWAGVWGGLR